MTDIKLDSDELIKPTWKDSIYRQREELARMLREPLALLAEKCVPVWSDRDGLNTALLEGFSSIPYCTYLYAVGTDGVQLSDHVSCSGLTHEHYQLNRSERPYMKETIPEWGFLLSDAYISQEEHRPSLTALQVVVSEAGTLGYLGADFDLRGLPVTSTLYQEPHDWRQVKGDPAIRSTLFQQTRTESPMDRHMQNALSILEELLAERGVFQCQIHFSSSQATIWTIDDPLRYRILDQEALMDPDICLLYPSRPYPEDAKIPRAEITRILSAMKSLRKVDMTIYLRTASVNIFNGMVSLTFSCDGSHYMRYDEFLARGASFWSGAAG
ncbi:MAG: hypothetical protein K1563_14285 [Candidatus Thiodiazotropha sp. (ex. Lucinisca nassula)]|nr:hypothetical protein [Candidatus Thiodiazotropha sp. (ex. Lucinisca nassula)]